MFSIYSSFFNVEKMKFDWRDAIKNWLEFLNNSGELSIAVNTSEDKTFELVGEFIKKIKQENHRNLTKIVLTEASIPYDDPEFDGKLKALALSKCTEPFCILLDCDERIIPSMRTTWKQVAKLLENNGNIDALFIPVIDLFGDEKHYKSEFHLGSKWYLHKNRPELTRGVVNFAYRDDGSIDTSKSDTCELIYKDGNVLVRAHPILMPGVPHFLVVGQMQGGEVPFVYHLGWLDKEQRLRQSQFWQPVWKNRNKADIKPEMTLLEMENVRKYTHGLPSWKQ